MSSLPTGTVTFLFADVEGSTQLVQTTGTGYSELLADVRRLLRAEIASQGGIEMDATGDELSALFEEGTPPCAPPSAGRRRSATTAGPPGSPCGFEWACTPASPSSGKRATRDST